MYTAYTYSCLHPLQLYMVQSEWLIKFRSRQSKLHLHYCKACPLKAEKLVTEPLFYKDSIQAENGTVLYKRWIEKGVSHF